MGFSMDVEYMGLLWVYRIWVYYGCRVYGVYYGCRVYGVYYGGRVYGVNMGIEYMGLL